MGRAGLASLGDDQPYASGGCTAFSYGAGMLKSSLQVDSSTCVKVLTGLIHHPAWAPSFSWTRDPSTSSSSPSDSA